MVDIVSIFGLLYLTIGFPLAKYLYIFEKWLTSKSGSTFLYSSDQFPIEIRI